MLSTKENSTLISKPYTQETGYKANYEVVFTALPVDGNTLTLNGTAFTFKDTPAVDDDVQIGTDIEETIDNLLTETLPVEAMYSKSGTDTVVIEYNETGVAGNSYTLASDFLTVDATLSGGSEIVDTDWVKSIPSIDYKLPELFLGNGINAPIETTADTLVVYGNEIDSGLPVKVYNPTDGVVKGVLGSTVSYEGDNGVNTHDIFGDGSAVATYQLDGDVTDLGGNYDGVATSLSYDIGVFGQAAVFNGADSRILLPTPSSFALQSLTVSAWVKTTITASGSIFSIDTSYSNGLGGGIHIQINSSGCVIVYHGSGDGSWENIIGSKIITDNVFHHVTVSVLNGGDVSIYIDGVLDTRSLVTPAAIDYTDLTTVTIGENPVGANESYYFNGLLDQVRIFNKAVAPAEVSELYAESATKYNSDISSFNLTEAPTKAWLDKELVVSTCTEDTEDRCLVLPKESIGVL